MRSSKLAFAAAVAAISTLAATHRAAQAKWSVEIKQVDAGTLDVAPEFKVGIYENLADELVKTKQFASVLRTGDRSIDGVPDLLILKTSIEAYKAGSETIRAVTTFGGATTLKVRTQLCKRDGEVVFERVIDGNVRFFGGNLRATHNLAHHVADAIKQAKLTAPAQ